MKYCITIQGQGGHGSRPDLSHNPVDCFAAVFGALQGTGCQISQVDGGTAPNIIPDKLTSIMECRCSEDALARILGSTCQLYHCGFKIIPEEHTIILNS